MNSVSIASALLEIGAVGFVVDNPITFKSGIISPVYIDNRIFPYHPKQWRIVLEGFVELINTKKLEFDIVAGIETAGIPHSATLGYLLNKPSVFCRKQSKDHGTKKLIEGGEVKGKRVLLIEDHVSTGGSSMLGVKALREAGAIVTDCLSITSYEFHEAHELFTKENVALTTLTTFSDILSTACQTKVLNESHVKSITQWLHNPTQWGR